MNVPPGDFVADSQSQRRPGERARYDGAIPLAWQIVDAFGGLTMSVALRAMQDELARPELRLVAANVMFVDRVPCGPVVIDVEVLRSGRRIAQLAAKLRTSDTRTRSRSADRTRFARAMQPRARYSGRATLGSGRPSRPGTVQSYLSV